MKPKQVAEHVFFAGVFLLIYGAIWGFQAWFNWTDAQDNLDPQQWHWVRWGFFGLCVAAHAVYRAWAPNPLLRTQYGFWLSTTPWRHGQPALLGPIWPTRSDAVWVLALSVIAAVVDGLPWWILPTVFVAAWALTVLSCCARHGNVMTWVVFGIPLTCYPWLGWWQLPVVISILAVIVARRYRKQLDAFPYETETGSPAEDPESALAALNLGWPFSTLNPHAHGPKASDFFHALSALAVVWYLHAGIAVVIRASELEPFLADFDMSPMHGSLAKVWMGLVCVAAVLKYIQYFTTGRPAMGLWARLRNKRWRLRGYDRIHRVPLIIIAVGSVFGYLLGAGIGPLRLVFEAGVFAMTWTVLAVGPSDEDWRLTAPVAFSKSSPKTAAQRKGKSIEVRLRFAGRNV